VLYFVAALRLIDSWFAPDSQGESKRLDKAVMILSAGRVTTTIKSHLSTGELEARYEGAGDPIAKSHFHALCFQGLRSRRGCRAVVVLDALGLPTCQTLQRGPYGTSDMTVNGYPMASV
jgi:hypothetical protein